MTADPATEAVIAVLVTGTLPDCACNDTDCAVCFGEGSVLYRLAAEAVVAAVRPVILEEAAQAVEAAPTGRVETSYVKCIPEICQYGGCGPGYKHQVTEWIATDYAAILRALAGTEDLR